MDITYQQCSIDIKIRVKYSKDTCLL